MVNKPKAIGTAAETAVVRVARDRGFPDAERLALAGAQDLGDVRLCPGVHLEVKGGHAAESASDAQVEAWLVETERELEHAGATVGALVTKRKAIGNGNADRWWAHVRSSWWDRMRGVEPGGPDYPVRMTLSDLLCQLRASGYGEQ